MGAQDQPVRLYLMRHGQTEWSISGQHTGLTDIPLTAHGEEEARTLAPRLHDIQFTHVFSSPLQRAQKTRQLAGLQGAVIEPDLTEWDYGSYEGTKSVDIHKTRPDWNIFHDGCPDGESPEQVAARADRLIARLRALTGNVALFSHGHFGAVLATRWIGLAIAEGEHFPLATASVSILGYEANHPGVPVLKQWNG